MNPNISIESKPFQKIDTAPEIEPSNNKKRKYSSSSEIDLNETNKRLKLNTSETKTEEVSRCALSETEMTYKKNDILSTIHNLLIQIPQIIKHQIGLIINCTVFSRYTTEEQTSILSTILLICQNLQTTDEAKCSELGILYFYVAFGDKHFIGCTDLVQFRINKIYTNAKTLKEKHKAVCPSNLQDTIPSGCTHHLLLSFVTMIFTPDGMFNPGGCMALKQMMKSRLNLFITPEMHMNICNVVDCLLYNDEFRNLFNEPFKIHKDLELFIRLDMKVPKSIPLHMLHVYWDILMALFHPQGQTEENCFALAPTMNLVNSQPAVLVKMLIETLKTGCFRFEGVEIPIHPLISGRIIYDDNFDLTLSLNDFSQTEAFSLIRDLLGESFIPKPSLEESSINNHLISQFDSNAEYAKLLLLSLKQNFLQNCCLSMIQFSAINSTNQINFKNKPKIFESKKVDIINDIIKNIKYSILMHQCEYLKILLETLKKEVFFVDFTIQNVEEYKLYETAYYKNNYNNMSNLKFISHLFILYNGNFRPIYKISEFHEYFKIRCRESKNYCTLKENESTNKIDEFINLVDSNEFIEIILNVIFMNNFGKLDFKIKNYKNANAFHILQNGNSPKYLYSLDHTKQIFKIPKKFTSTSVLDFFIKLCGSIGEELKINQHYFKNSNNAIIIKSKSHVYNLYPALFKKYCTESINEVIQKKIFDRVNGTPLLLKEKKLRALSYAAGKENSMSIYNKIESKNLGIDRFYQETKKIIQDCNLINHSINTVMYEISTTELKDNLHYILEELIPNQDPSMKEAKKFLKEKASKSEYIYPHVGANWIHKALLNSKAQIYISPELLEEKIRQIFNLPEVVILGSLNWIDKLSEKPHHNQLCVRYNFLNKQLELVERNKKIENSIDEDFNRSILNLTDLYFPN